MTRQEDTEARIQRRREQNRLRKLEVRKRMSPDESEYQRGRNRERMRTARRNMTKAQREYERVHKREVRRRQTPEQREKERERARRKLRPFMAVDGEGAGTDRLGRQPYLLMAASGPVVGDEHVKHCDGKPLSVRDCLEFLLSLPPEPILVGFYLGYDANQILRGIKIPTLKRILDPPQGRNGPCYTYWGDYAIIYQQGQYFRVARVDRSGSKPGIVKGSTRTIYDAFGFFQCSFAEAIKKWNIGSEKERAFIARNKEHRDEFSELTAEIIEYCKLECRCLAMLMAEFRAVCAAAGISPKQWSGAGWLAAALLEQHGIPKRPLTARETERLVRSRRMPGRQKP